MDLSTKLLRGGNRPSKRKFVVLDRTGRAIEWVGPATCPEEASTLTELYLHNRIRFFEDTAGSEVSLDSKNSTRDRSVYTVREAPDEYLIGALDDPDEVQKALAFPLVGTYVERLVIDWVS